jgi:hypothetical protein
MTNKQLSPKLEAIKKKYEKGATAEIIGEFMKNDKAVNRLLEGVGNAGQ